MKLTWDTSDFDGKISKVTPKLLAGASKAVGEAGDALLRLSVMEVPHDTGTLQKSGNVTKGNLESLVSYNTPYAVRVHEHPEFRFQKGRKGKYLESPLKQNVSLFRNIITNAIKKDLK